MKIKHFAGYGTLQAKKLQLTRTDIQSYLSVEIVGNHEKGLAPVYHDETLIKQWLIDRFDKSARDMLVRDMNINYTVDTAYAVINGIVTEYAVYHINYNNPGAEWYNGKW